MTATVTNLPTAKPVRRQRAKVTQVKKRVPRRPSAAAARAAARQRAAGYMNGAFAMGLTAMSLSHLAEFVCHATHRAGWEGWTMASIVDGGFIAAELLPFLATAECTHETRHARLAFRCVVLLASAAANAIAFSADCDCSYVWVARAIGVAVPGAIAYFAHMAGRCLLGRH